MWTVPYEGDTWFPDFESSDHWKAQPLFRHLADDRNEAAFEVLPL